jgi:prepilin-type N-terminal cleavage/methylation domain-containing protein/prepilin-type processing-associated H-X9-DG protein
MNTCNRISKKGFTLVELLVVIGIIAVLIAILLPGLARAKRAANTVACAANLRSILQGMNMYASQNKGAIPGSPWTSGQLVYSDLTNASVAPGISDDNCPSIVHPFDWASPILKVMGQKFNEGPTRADRVDRFNRIRSFQGFRCPENNILANSFGSVSFPTDVLLSYNTALAFMLQNNRSGATAGGPVLHTVARPEFNPPSGYAPKLNKVGSPSRKIYIADGARYSEPQAAPFPDANIELPPNNSNGSAFSDQGPWSKEGGRSWNRGKTPGLGNAAPGTRDTRIFAYRHGYQKQFARADLYKGNFGFFDGHVELLGDLESSRPEYWVPKGTSMILNQSQVWSDTLIQYTKGVGSGTPVIIP